EHCLTCFHQTQCSGLLPPPGLRYALSYLAKQDQKEHGIILMRSRLPEKSNRGRPRHN
ncbi:hypothetical protein, partial [Escherichia coli]|uniref:hypothetical protein n=1 Tax=Escherichia coli TaxID=562 RepID=UPI002033A68E